MTISAAADESSSMDTFNGDNHQHQLQSQTKVHSATTTSTDRRNSNTNDMDVFTDDDDDEGKNSETWSALKQSFKQVQSVLDRNRALIQQVNENHRSKTHDNLVKNVELIQEINGNISKVVSLYSDLSANFSGTFPQQNASKSDN